MNFWQKIIILAFSILNVFVVPRSKTIFVSVWFQISLALSLLSKAEDLAAVLKLLRTPPNRSVSSTTAVIALSAKMAKVYCLFTKVEVSSFWEFFNSLEAGLQKAACIFNLASKAISAFKLYAKNIISLFGHDNLVLKDLI